MDSILQKRLIGAVIVIAAAVVFIPMLLDGPGGSGVESVDLGIPEPGPDGMRTEVIPLDPTPPPAPVRTQPAPPKPAPAMPAPGASVAAMPDTSAGGPAAAVTAVPEPTSASAPPATLSSNAAPATSTHQADVSGRWHVNLGSYANEANAARLVSEMQRAGMPAEAESVTYAGKPARRVRVGPYADRVRAEAARLAIAGIRRDLTPSLVQDDSREAEPAPRATAAASTASETAPRNPASEATTASRTPATTDVRGWVVQVGAFSTPADAASQATKMRDAGFTAFIDRLDAPKGTLHRVRVGPEAQRANAERLRVSIQSKLGVDGVVMRHP